MCKEAGVASRQRHWEDVQMKAWASPPALYNVPAQRSVSNSTHQPWARTATV